MEELTPFMRTMQTIKEFLVQKKVGNIVVNCFKGGISTVEIHETLNWAKEAENAKKGGNGKE